MTKVITLALIAFSLSFTCLAKKFDINSHINVVGALTSVKSSANSVRVNTKEWPKKAQADMMALYTDTKKASDVVIATYEIVIANYKQSQKQQVDLTEQLKAMEEANNKMVKAFKDGYQKYNSGQKINVTAEMIKLVFGAAEDIYKFVKGIKDNQKAAWKSDVEAQRITKEYTEK